MFGFSFQWLLIASLAAFLAGGYTSYKATVWYYDAQNTARLLKEEKAKTARLEENLRLIREVLGKDNTTAEDDLRKLEEIKNALAKLLESTPNSGGLSATTVDGLRNLFGRTK